MQTLTLTSQPILAEMEYKYRLMFGPGLLRGVDRLDPGLTKTNKNKLVKGVPGRGSLIGGSKKSLTGSRNF